MAEPINIWIFAKTNKNEVKSSNYKLLVVLERQRIECSAPQKWKQKNTSTSDQGTTENRQ